MNGVPDKAAHARVNPEPAFDAGPPAACAGPAWEGELEPCIGARLVDALHRQFHEAFVE